MSKVLVQFSDNWADEMDLEGFRMMTIEQWEKIEARARRWFDANPNEEYEHCMGNQSLFWSSYEEWRNCYAVTPLSDAGVETLTKLLTADSTYYGAYEEPDFDGDEDEE